MDLHLQKLARRFHLSYEKPSGGVYFWVRLPEGMKAAELLAQAQKEGVTFIPGDLFDPRHKLGRDHIRLNFSYPRLERIDQGMQMLERALEKLAHKETKQLAL